MPRQEKIHYDILHSHYWLSGMAACDLRAAWGIPIVQMFHTLGAVKNRVAAPDERESDLRIHHEGEIMGFADRLVAATALERRDMETLYSADPRKISIVPPGVDLERFRPLPANDAKARIGVCRDRP